MPEEYATRPLDNEELKLLVTYLRKHKIEPILVGGQGVMRSKGVEDDSNTKDTDFMVRNGDDSAIDNGFLLYKLEKENHNKLLFDNIGWVDDGEFSVYAANLIRKDKTAKPARIDFINSYNFTHIFSRSGKDLYKLAKEKYSIPIGIMDETMLSAHAELIAVMRTIVPAKEKYVAKVERDAKKLLLENEVFEVEEIAEIMKCLEIDDEKIRYLTSVLKALYQTKTNQL